MNGKAVAVEMLSNIRSMKRKLDEMEDRISKAIGKKMKIGDVFFELLFNESVCVDGNGSGGVGSGMVSPYSSPQKESQG